MSKRTAVANGADPVQKQAASDGNAVQDACNLVAVVGCFHRHLLALHRSGVCGDDPHQPSCLAGLHQQAQLALSHD